MISQSWRRDGIESLVGSSRKTLGLADQRAGHREPPLLAPGQVTTRALRSSSTSAARATVCVACRTAQRQRLGDGELVGELRLLQLNAESVAQRPACRPLTPRRPEDLDLATVGHGEALEDFDRGGLPRPVGSQQAEALAGADGEIQTGNRDDLSKALGEGATADGYDLSDSLSFSGRISWAALSA